MMKTKDIAKEYGIDQHDFEQFIMWQKDMAYKNSLTAMTIDDDNVETYVQKYQTHVAEMAKKKEKDAERGKQAKLEREKEEEERRREEAEKQRVLASMLVTSGFSFDGYKITKYSGYISGDDAVSIARGTSGIFLNNATDVSKSLTDSLAKIRRNALQELKEAAYDLGCNAVIGVDYDYITLEPETANSAGGTTYLPYVFCVTANGNAVIIEKTDE